MAGQFLPSGTSRRAADQFRRKLAYKRDPAHWIHNRLHEDTWSKQDAICASVVANRRTAVRSCHGTGKSYIASRLVAWWLDVHPPGEAFVVTTAPTGAQVSAILWREIGRAHRKGDLPGRITSGSIPSWKINEELVAYGRKPQDLTSSEEAMQAFQGIHARHVLVVLDEACGIPKWLWDAVSTLVTNENGRVLAIGNPDNPAAHFEKVCRPGSGWNTIGISIHDWFAEMNKHRQLQALLVGREFLTDAERDWGKASPLYQSKVLGQFPDTSDDMLITPAMVAIAHELDLPGRARGNYALDVARFGDDETVCYRNRGGVVREEWAMHKAATTKTTGRIVDTLRQHKGTVPVVVDGVGVGGGVVDNLREAKEPVIEYGAGGAAREPKRFVDRRAEDFWTLREQMEGSEVDLDSADEKLSSQLQTLRWTLTAKGKIQVESKKEMKKRGLPSPDRADTCCMAVTGTIPYATSSERRLGKSQTSDLLDRPM